MARGEGERGDEQEVAHRASLARLRAGSNQALSWVWVPWISSVARSKLIGRPNR